MLWLLFFLVLGFDRQQLTRFTGWSVILLSLPTCSLPAFLMLTDAYRTSSGIAVIWAIGLTGLSVVAKVISSHRTPVVTGQPVYN